MNDLLYKKLEDICLDEKRAIISGPFGSNISSKYFVDKGIPVIRGNNLSLSLDKFYDEGFVYVTKKKADELNCYAKKLDIIFTAAGTIGQVGLITNDTKYDCYVISNKQIRARLDPNKIDILYAYYWFTSPWIQKYLTSNNKGSTVPLLSLWEVKNLPIIYPKSMSKQKKISNIIDKISKKIELNNKINDELEVMAKTIYDYWFLQFEFPNEEGKPYKSSGGKMVWNEELKREIPEGWEVKTLYDIADYINGLACQKYRPINKDNILPVIKIVEMHNGITSNTEYVRDDIPLKNIIDTGDILFSWSASLEVTLWKGKKAGLNQHIFKVVPKFYPKYYIYMQLSAYIINFIKIAETRKTTMGHITIDHLKQSKILLPNIKLAKTYDIFVKDLFEKILLNNIENQELTSLRDFLLPLLMNGQVGFKEDKAEG